jgi:murein DD-endopeptidase MepM/ murein hydrolase activator NlpD
MGAVAARALVLAVLAAVAPGRRVSAGELLGRVGSTGASTGSHLHLELFVRGANVDPAGALR